MKRFTVVLLALILALSLAACGGEPAAEDADPNDSGDVAETQEPAQAAPEAVLYPDEIEWGYENYDPSSSVDDTQHWYVDGVKNADNYIFFWDDAFLTVVQGAAEETYDIEYVDMHVVDTETGGEVFDFVFTDVFTCYDLVSDVWYMRADYDTLIEQITSPVYVCEVGSQWSYTFNDDGTMVYDNDGELLAGTWWFTDANTIDIEYDDHGSWVNINYEDGTWNIVSIEDVDVYFPE